MKTVILTIFILGLATYLFVRYMPCGCAAAEGFQANQEKPNPLIKLVKKLGTMSKYLSNPNMWKERIEMFSMTPTELARRHLNNMKKQK